MGMASTAASSLLVSQKLFHRGHSRIGLGSSIPGFSSLELSCRFSGSRNSGQLAAHIIWNSKPHLKNARYLPSSIFSCANRTSEPSVSADSSHTEGAAAGKSFYCKVLLILWLTIMCFNSAFFLDDTRLFLFYVNLDALFRLQGSRLWHDKESNHIYRLYVGSTHSNLTMYISLILGEAQRTIICLSWHCLRRAKN